MDKVIYKNTFPFFPILGLIFITLKLTGYIDWSWWWVTAPIWGGIAIGLLALFLFFSFGVIALCFTCFAFLLDEFKKFKKIKGK